MVIYKAEFPNGKVYIGKSKSFDDRKIKHYYSTRYYNTKLTNAINKYGFDDFDFLIVAECYSEEELCEKEVEFVKRYKSMIYENGYNLREPGGNSGKFSEETKRLMSERRKDGGSHWNGKKHKESTKILISNGNKNKIVSEETRNKISLAKMGTESKRKGIPKTREELMHKMDKTVYKFIHESGETYEGICYDFYNKYELSNTLISRMVRGLTSKHKGWSLSPDSIMRKEKLREVSEERKENLRIKNSGMNKGRVVKNFGKDNGMFGKTHSEEIRRKISENLIGKRKGIPKTEEEKIKISNGLKKDKNIYEFHHKDGSVYIGNKYDFIEKYNVDRTQISRIIQRIPNFITVKGWVFIKIVEDKCELILDNKS